MNWQLVIAVIVFWWVWGLGCVVLARNKGLDFQRQMEAATMGLMLGPFGLLLVTRMSSNAPRAASSTAPE
jgi:tellurite resistance protein TehA-like permease